MSAYRSKFSERVTSGVLQDVGRGLAVDVHLGGRRPAYVLVHNGNELFVLTVFPGGAFRPARGDDFLELRYSDQEVQ